MGIVPAVSALCAILLLLCLSALVLPSSGGAALKLALFAVRGVTRRFACAACVLPWFVLDEAV